jgi:DNA topoisomerase-1
MPSAVIERTGIALDAGKYRMKANGSTIVFDGFMRVYRAANETILPELAEGEKLKAKSIEPKQHFTQPPARYSDASLIKILEEHGIGRPSTYAPTLSTIESRGYVIRDDQKKLQPTDIAFIVTDLLVQHFSEIVDFEFTADMEKKFDDIAEGEIKWQKVMKEFYDPFHKNLKEKDKSLSREDIVKPRLLGTDPKTKLPIHARTGRFGAYIQLGNPEEKETIKNISLPKDLPFDQVTLEQALDLLTLPRLIGKLEDGTEIQGLIGPYGPYLKAGSVNASIPPELYDVLTITEAEARTIVVEAAALKKIQQEPLATLGEDPETKKTILVKTGRFGPYITDGKTNVSVPKSRDPLSVDLATAIERLAAKRANPKARWPREKTK